MASTGGLSGLAALTAQQTGWSNINTEEEVVALIDDKDRSSAVLEAMSQVYGKETLSKMKPDQLYSAYKDFVVSRKK